MKILFFILGCAVGIALICLVGVSPTFFAATGGIIFVGLYEELSKEREEHMRHVFVYDEGGSNGG